MEKLKMEQMLMQQESINVLKERAAYLKNKYGENGTTRGEEAEKVVMVQQVEHELGQTIDEIKANDHDVVARSELMQDLTQFIPDYTEAEPRALLKTLTKRLQENPSLSEQLILENVINNITSIETIDQDGEKLITDAIKVLMSAGEPKKKGGK